MGYNSGDYNGDYSLLSIVLMLPKYILLSFTRSRLVALDFGHIRQMQVYLSPKQYVRFMHLVTGALRGIEIARRPSVVTLMDQDHIGWKSWKLIARTISPTCSPFVAQRPSTYAQGNMGKFGETRGGVGKKWRAGAQKRQ